MIKKKKILKSAGEGGAYKTKIRKKDTDFCQKQCKQKRVKQYTSSAEKYYHSEFFMQQKIAFKNEDNFQTFSDMQILKEFIIRRLTPSFQEEKKMIQIEV